MIHPKLAFRIESILFTIASVQEGQGEEQTKGRRGGAEEGCEGQMAAR